MTNTTSCNRKAFPPTIYNKSHQTKKSVKTNNNIVTVMKDNQFQRIATNFTNRLKIIKAFNSISCMQKTSQT